jgi:hypothetical protein
MDEISQKAARKGRGARSNAVGRFEGYEKVKIDDGWGIADEAISSINSSVTEDMTRTIIARNRSPDVPFDRSVNVFRGCEHGCIYCFARPTHAYLGLSPGLDFESRGALASFRRLVSEWPLSTEDRRRFRHGRRNSPTLSDEGAAVVLTTDRERSSRRSSSQFDQERGLIHVSDVTKPGEQQDSARQY